MPRLGDRMLSVRTRVERDWMVNEHWRLSHYAAWRWAKSFHLEVEEAHSECNVALIRAAELWRSDGGKTFAAYAIMAMYHHLLNCAKKQRKRVAVPLLEDEWEWAADPKQPDPAHEVAEQDDVQVHLTRLHAAIRRLSPRSQVVMLGRASGEGYASIAQRLSLSRQRVQQIEQAARERLREILHLE